MAGVYKDLEYPLDQGDILEEADIATPLAGESDSPIIGQGRNRALTAVIVTSHGCDCEKHERMQEKDHETDRLVLQVAPVHPISQLSDDGFHNDIRKGRVPKYFYIPDEGDREEMVVDLWLEQPLPADDLLKLKRVATLSEDWCLRLVLQILALRSHKQIEDFLGEDVAP